jgi:serine/threonine-protein kinase RsbW
LIRHTIAEYASTVGITGERLDAVRLAVSEAVTNVVVHAYRAQPGQVQVTTTAVDGELWVLIADDGCGPHIPAATPGAGWGLPLITDACDEFTLLERAEGGTEARMRFLIATKRPEQLRLVDR